MDIKVKNLNFGYDNLIIFKNYNTTILNNRYNAVIGQSGSGKTTLLRILSGLESEYSGDIEGMDDKSISICFQENRLLENYSIKDNINFVQKENLSDSYIELELKKIGLDIDMNKKVYQLSGGMKRRIAILRCVLYDADIFILDEPFKELDEFNYNLTINYVKNKLLDKTVVFTTHNEKEINLFWANVINCCWL